MKSEYNKEKHFFLNRWQCFSSRWFHLRKYNRFWEWVLSTLPVEDTGAELVDVGTSTSMSMGD